MYLHISHCRAHSLRHHVQQAAEGIRACQSLLLNMLAWRLSAIEMGQRGSVVGVVYWNGLCFRMGASAKGLVTHEATGRFHTVCALYWMLAHLVTLHVFYCVHLNHNREHVAIYRDVFSQHSAHLNPRKNQQSIADTRCDLLAPPNAPV